jgi:hypothetical protein
MPERSENPPLRATPSGIRRAPALRAPRPRCSAERRSRRRAPKRPGTARRRSRLGSPASRRRFGPGGAGKPWCRSRSPRLPSAHCSRTQTHAAPRPWTLWWRCLPPRGRAPWPSDSRPARTSRGQGRSSPPLRPRIRTWGGRTAGPPRARRGRWPRREPPGTPERARRGRRSARGRQRLWPGRPLRLRRPP